VVKEKLNKLPLTGEELCEILSDYGVKAPGRTDIYLGMLASEGQSAEEIQKARKALAAVDGIKVGRNVDDVRSVVVTEKGNRLSFRYRYWHPSKRRPLHQKPL
jgi:hypothetical protein